MRSPVQHSHTMPLLLLHKVAFHAPRRVDVHDPLDTKFSWFLCIYHYVTAYKRQIKPSAYRLKSTHMVMRN